MREPEYPAGSILKALGVGAVVLGVVFAVSCLFIVLGIWYIVAWFDPAGD